MFLFLNMLDLNIYPFLGLLWALSVQHYIDITGRGQDKRALVIGIILFDCFELVERNQLAHEELVGRLTSLAIGLRADHQVITQQIHRLYTSSRVIIRILYVIKILPVVELSGLAQNKLMQ